MQLMKFSMPGTVEGWRRYRDTQFLVREDVPFGLSNIAVLVSLTHRNRKSP